jgi:hypothetical protein
MIINRKPNAELRFKPIGSKDACYACGCMDFTEYWDYDGYNGYNDVFCSNPDCQRQQGWWYEREYHKSRAKKAAETVSFSLNVLVNKLRGSKAKKNIMRSEIL